MRYNDRIYINLQTEYTHSTLNTWLSYLGEHIHKAFFSIWWYVGISGKPFTRSTTIINLRLKKQFSQLIVFLSQRRIDSWKMDQVVKILLLDYKLCRYSIIPTPTPMSFNPRGGGGRQYSWTHSTRSFRQRWEQSGCYISWSIASGSRPGYPSS